MKFEKLKEWAGLLEGRNYREEITLTEAEELKKDGIVVIFGASDDLCELNGAITDEIDCWDKTKYVYVKEKEVFLKIDYYSENDELIEINLKDRPFIDIKFGEDGWKYKIPEIQQAEFNILDEGKQYCKGILFYKDEFENYGKRMKTKIEIQEKITHLLASKLIDNLNNEQKEKIDIIVNTLKWVIGEED